MKITAEQILKLIKQQTLDTVPEVFRLPSEDNSDKWLAFTAGVYSEKWLFTCLTDRNNAYEIGNASLEFMTIHWSEARKATLEEIKSIPVHKLDRLALFANDSPSVRDYYLKYAK